jgi:hypothetical protein
MTYDRSRRDDERRKADEKRRQDHLRRKAAEQKAIDDRRRAEAAKAKQKQQPSKPITPKPVTVTPQDVTPLIPAQSDVTPQRPKKTDLSGLLESAKRLDAERAQQRQAQSEQANSPPEPEQPRPFWETMFTPDPPKYKGFLEKVGELGGKAWNKVTSFGSGFGGQFLDNQATTAAQDAINPQAREARKDWLQRQGEQDPAFKAGQTTADIVNIGQGVIQMKQGVDSIGGGIGATASGQLHLAAPAIAGGAVNVGTGAVTSHRAFTHLMSSGSSGRLSNSDKARSNHEEAGGTLNDGDQAHHVNTDKTVRNHKLNKIAREKIGYDLDRATNIEAFPSADKVYPEGPQVLHRGSHPKWDTHVERVLDRMTGVLKKKYGSLEKVPKGVLEKTMESVETQLKNDIPDLQRGLQDGWLKPTPHGNYKLSENTIGQEEKA